MQERRRLEALAKRIDHSAREAVLEHLDDLEATYRLQHDFDKKSRQNKSKPTPLKNCSASSAQRFEVTRTEKPVSQT